MTVEEAVEYYGTLYQVCKALGIRPQNGSIWRRNGVIPLRQQLRLQRLSNGVLQVDDEEVWPPHGNEKAEQKRRQEAQKSGG